jgi:hypothetical protein
MLELAEINKNIRGILFSILKENEFSSLNSRIS